MKLLDKFTDRFNKNLKIKKVENLLLHPGKQLIDGPNIDIILLLNDGSTITEQIETQIEENPDIGISYHAKGDFVLTAQQDMTVVKIFAKFKDPIIGEHEVIVHEEVNEVCQGSDLTITWGNGGIFTITI